MPGSRRIAAPTVADEPAAQRIAEAIHREALLPPQGPQGRALCIGVRRQSLPTWLTFSIRSVL